jgi:Putative transposase/Transposase zinc-binding domain
LNVASYQASRLRRALDSSAIIAYRSCNHRSCPKCGGANAQAWLDGQCERLLPVPYFLVTFTLPEQLRVACRSHQRLFYEILFDESAATLKEIASIPRYLGGELGFLGILHTWTRQLAYHPHVHYIVPGGGLRPDGGKWRKCRITKKGEPYLLPVELLSHHFRHRFKERLRAQAPEIFNTIASQVWLVDWVVHSQSAGAGRQALGYLSAYVFRTALSNKRLISDQNGDIAFGYIELQTGKSQTLVLDAISFLARVLQHVLPAGFHKVRYYGWMHPRARKRFCSSRICSPCH